MPEGLRQVFVYGTLMPGQLRWPGLERFATGVQRATAWGRIWDTGLGYPAAVFDAGGGTIPGFLVTLEPDLAAVAVDALDRIEGEGALFRRVTVRTSGGQAISYEWLGSTDGLRPLPRGWPEGSATA